MILTGKSKESFFKFFFKTNDLDNIQDFEFEEFNYLSEVQKYAIIIEWFDSVGIRIGIDPYYDMSGTYRADISNLGFQAATRQEATKQAIIKANEIYNSL